MLFTYVFSREVPALDRASSAFITLLDDIRPCVFEYRGDFLGRLQKNATSDVRHFSLHTQSAD
jgi:hypothetical protein